MEYRPQPHSPYALSKANAALAARSGGRTCSEAQFDILLYDLTSSYFESDPPADDEDKRRHGYSRDKRSDCVQVVIALIVTPEGFPLAYEVLTGNTSDRTRTCTP